MFTSFPAISYLPAHNRTRVSGPPRKASPGRSTMNTPPLPSNPSQSVERIGEIVVGRQLSRLEERLARLEAHDAGAATPVDDRLAAAEARIEALEASLRRLTETTCDDVDRDFVHQGEEIQRLAARFQRLPSTPAAAATAAAHPLEQRLGDWLHDWQKSSHQHARNREQQLIQRFDDEVATLRNWAEARITHLENTIAAIHQRLDQIATAAHVLAAAAAPDPQKNP